MASDIFFPDLSKALPEPDVQPPRQDSFASIALSGILNSANKLADKFTEQQRTRNVLDGVASSMDELGLFAEAEAYRRQARTATLNAFDEDDDFLKNLSGAAIDDLTKMTALKRELDSREKMQKEGFLHSEIQQEGTFKHEESIEDKRQEGRVELQGSSQSHDIVMEGTVQTGRESLERIRQEGDQNLQTGGFINDVALADISHVYRSQLADAEINADKSAAQVEMNFRREMQEAGFTHDQTMQVFDHIHREETQDRADQGASKRAEDAFKRKVEFENYKFALEHGKTPEDRQRIFLEKRQKAIQDGILRSDEAASFEQSQKEFEPSDIQKQVNEYVDPKTTATSRAINRIRIFEQMLRGMRFNGREFNQRERDDFRNAALTDGNLFNTTTPDGINSLNALNEFVRKVRSGEIDPDRPIIFDVGQREQIRQASSSVGGGIIGGQQRSGPNANLFPNVDQDKLARTKAMAESLEAVEKR